MLQLFIITVFSLSLFSCGEKSKSNDSPAVDAVVEGKDKAEIFEDTPEISGNAGQLLIQIPSNVDPESVQGYVVGYEEQLKLERSKDGYFINNVPEGEHDVIIQAGTLAINLTGDLDRGIRLGSQKFLNGVQNKPSDFSIPVAGSISGVVKLNRQTDHAGIDVYIPGTTFVAKTDKEGKFSFSNMPVGIHNLYFESDGFYRGQIEGIEVKTQEEKALDGIVLIESTGVEGGLLPLAGSSVVNSLDVGLNIWAAGERPTLMKLSESDTFAGSSWTPISSRYDYKFGTQGEKTLYIKFSDANGLESSPFRAIFTIDLFSDGLEKFTPSFVVQSTIIAPNNEFDLTDITVPERATKMWLTVDGVFDNAAEAALGTSYTYGFPNSPSSCGTKNIGVYFEDIDGFKSIESSISEVSLICAKDLADTDAFGTKKIYDSYIDGDSAYVLHSEAGVSAFRNYSFSTNSWSNALTTTPTMSWGGASQNWYDSKYYVFGGTYFETASPYSTDIAKVYDSGLDSWSDFDVSGGGAAPTARGNHTAVWAGSKLFIFGGQRLDADGNSTPDEFYSNGAIYDSVAKTWTALNNTGAPTQRYSAHGFYDAINNRVIIFGGKNSTSQNVYTGSYYDLDDSTWTVLPGTFPHTTLSGYRISNANNKLAVWGGKEAGNPTSKGAVFDGSNWSATDTVNAPTARNLYGFHFDGDNLIVYGGQTASFQSLNDGKQLNLTTGNWTDLYVDGTNNHNVAIFQKTSDGFFVASGDDTGASNNYNFKMFYPFN